MFRLALIGSLGESGLGDLELHFADPDVLVRRVVASAVARIGTESAVDYMVTALKDEDVFVRGVASAFLADLGTQ